MRHTSSREKGYDFLCISKKEYEFMPGSQQPISTWDSIKVPDKKAYRLGMNHIRSMDISRLVVSRYIDYFLYSDYSI